MTSNPESNAPGMGAFAEVEAAILREVTSGLNVFVKELKKRKLPTIKLRDESWLDDHDGITRYITVHGFLLNKDEYPELYTVVLALLKLAEVEVDRVKIYVTAEDGITIHAEKDVSNEYGREIGTDNKNFSIKNLVEEAKEKVQQHNIDKLKLALHRLLESLEEVRE
jgi:hypothetical protein